ncbi:MAG: 16S rRNA (cytosine(1402)-N(4))-methyltransferase RsmH [Bdellovibrio sp.]|nr:16S rRNA (cytosine(1402)-N(4))-methyltransferase RsmH [Bdellovibrio sp.]
MHIPILLNTICDYLIERFYQADQPSWLVDCTLGGAGHTKAFLKKFTEDPRLQKHKVLALDQDPQVIQSAQENFEHEILDGKLELQCTKFSSLSDIAKGRLVLGVLADLGFSSDQIENPQRGFSFLREGPLDMRFNPTVGVSCEAFLKFVSEKKLVEIFSLYGEERFSKRIAANIINARSQGELKTTTQLANVILYSVPARFRYHKTHPATRCFQALRVYLNEELQELDQLLNNGILCLEEGGRVAVLSFHSLEDRMVKQTFKNPQLGLKVLTKKAIIASIDEINNNPRARSAKLRVAERQIKDIVPGGML